MAQEIEIAIKEADLGHAEREFGLDQDDLKLLDADGEISVNVFVDGELAELTKGPHKSIIAKAPSLDGKRFFAVVTGNDGQILNVLRYEGNKKIPIEDPADDEFDLKGHRSGNKKNSRSNAPFKKSVGAYVGKEPMYVHQTKRLRAVKRAGQRVD